MEGGWVDRRSGVCNIVSSGGWVGVGGIAGAAGKLARLALRAVKTRGHRSSPKLTQRRPPGAKYTWCMDVEGPAEVVTLPMKSVFLCISYATFSMQCYYEGRLGGEIRTTLERAAAGPTAAEAR